MINNKDKEIFNKLIDEIENLDPNCEFEYYQITDKMTNILTKNLADTIEYLDTCSKKELDWASECFEDLAEHFKSQDLINCVERNITRFDDTELQKQLQMEFGYMKMHMQK